MKTYIAAGVILILNIIINKMPLWAQEVETAPSSSIVLPDPEVIVEDLSRIEFEEENEAQLEDTLPDFATIDIEEIANTRISEKLLTDLLEEIQNEQLAGGGLSTFRFYYGTYDHLFLNINLGKSAQNLNYILSYIRNTRNSIGIYTNKYYNTELAVDDLSAGFIYSFNDHLDLNLNAGYYNQEIGLYTNPVLLSESKLNVPLKLELIYNIDLVSRFKAGMNYQILWLTHKSLTSYINKMFSQLGGYLLYHSNWSKDNYLKLSATYDYQNLSSNIMHTFDIYAVDKFPIVNGLALEVGGQVFLYSYKTTFWYPKAFLFYKFQDLFQIKAGIDGKMENFSISKLVIHNQIDYASVYPEEKWSVTLGGIDLTLLKWITVRLSSSYDLYDHFINYSYNSITGLYTPFNETNIQMVVVSGAIEIVGSENFILNLSYEHFFNQNTNLLIFPTDNFSLVAEYNQPNIGFQASTRTSLKGNYQIEPGVTIPYAFIWDIALSKSLNQQLFIDVQLNNILNMPYFEKNNVPHAGISYQAGIKILL